MKNNEIFSSLLGFTILALCVFGVLRWLAIPTGDFLDWGIGIASFWWLLFITTIPWDTHFKAKEVLAEAQYYTEKTQKNIQAQDLSYAKRIAQVYLGIALVLHLLSGVALYLIAYYQISAVGYWGAGLAILLTRLRPSARLYAYVHYRLTMITKDMKFPKDDVYTLKTKLEELNYKVESLSQKLDAESPDSWLTIKEKQLKHLEEAHYSLKKEIENFKISQETALTRHEQKQEQRISQISEDAQLLSQVRELVRFIKNA
ncbi:hypothetical protein [Hugenholtzia roseola]|uniref:hypothetical protein n=1 Tax=Hugenholtzia roseola TaxID=1002 RepID=UPI0004010FE0|nr:hypothetical protein [Hugenholtzia roseola]